MGKLYSIITTLFLALCSATSFGQTGYEWWFDNDVSDRHAGSLSNGRLDLQIDVSGLSEGLHGFNCRLNDANGTWGSVYRKMILLPTSSRPRSIAEAYEYWIDDDYSGKVSGMVSTGNNAYVIDLQDLPEGLHRFNYRLRSQYGDWGSIYCRYFYNGVRRPSTSIVTYEYWLDNDYSGRKTGTVDSNQLTFDIDLSDLDMTGDFHCFNMRLCDSVKGWGSIYRKILVFPTENNDYKVTGYRHRINGIDLGYVGIEEGQSDSYSFSVDIPEEITMNAGNIGTPVFNGNHVSVEENDSIHYSIQLKSAMGWSAPKTWDIALSRAFSTTAVEMAVNSNHDFVTPNLHEFVAVKFISTGNPLYFRSTVPIALDLYRDGVKIMDFPATDVGQMVSAQLEAGEYFCILHNAEALSEQFTFHVMDTANRVPTPQIEFEDGMVTITCSRGDAEIHYTIDDPNLTVESSLYTAPFQIERNVTIRAFAFIPGLDIEPSEIATRVIDSFKVKPPAWSFDLDTRLLTITCETEEATILYSFTEDGTWIEYTAPIAITRNRTVYAKATLDGWNDSDVQPIRITELADNVPAPEIDFTDGTVTITCANTDAEIHYTIDDPNLTAESPIYTGPFQIERNATIRAFAFIPELDIEPSEIATRIIDSFKVEPPVWAFNADTRLLTITCGTAGATILYSFTEDGPWTEYTAPIAITRNCTMYAKATRDGWNDSDVEPISITGFPESVATPEIGFDDRDRTVKISCDNEEAEIHYTIDDPNLTAESPIYTGPFQIDRNVTIRAFAFIPGLDIEPSGIATKVIDSFKVKPPTGSFDPDTRLVTIECETEGATILYAFESDGTWITYTVPFTVESNGTIHAMAILDGWNDSDVAEIVVSDMKCSGISSFDYHGRYVSLETAEEDAYIYYTTNGSDPTGGTPYTGSFDIEGLCTVRAVVVKDGYLNSDVMEIPITHYADEVHAETAAEGLLAAAFDWDETGLQNRVETFRIEGRLNDSDYAFIRSMNALRHLDIAEVEDAHVPDYAFHDSKLISISLPEDLTECGRSILSEVENLSSVIWNSRRMNVGEEVTQGLANPNVLLYIPTEATVTNPDEINIVRDGSADSITLRYGYPFYARHDFTAARVSLTHEFLQTTVIDTCRGWETIVLPFTPTKITHEVNGPALPFAAWNEDAEGYKPFWLYSAVSDGWKEAEWMEACVPYIISMPNNPEYVQEYNLDGKVTFSAETVSLGPSTSIPDSIDWMGGAKLIGTFMPFEDSDVHSLNVGSTEGGLQPGSHFVPGGSTPPFGAYISGWPTRRAIPLFGGSNGVELPLIADTGLEIETPAPGMLRVCSGRRCKVAVTTVTGVTIRTLNLTPGEPVTLEGLTRDLYIVGGRKVMVR